MSADQLIFSVQIFLLMVCVAGGAILTGHFIAAGYDEDCDE